MKGASSKEIITNKILEAFPNSFLNDKEIRIPMMEDGEEVQIKCVLTASKTNIPHCGTPVTSAETAVPAFQEGDMNKPTSEEKAEVEELLKKLGL